MTGSSPIRFGPRVPLFRCPECRRSLVVQWQDGEPRCAQCGWIAGGRDGVLNFVRNSDRASELAHYDAEYVAHAHAPTDLDSLSEQWRSLYYPMNRAVWERVGDLNGKTAVLLGNGSSAKELCFLTLKPGILVYSDLSAAAVRAAAERFRASDTDDVLQFAVIDAQDLPFVDGTVDLVYGYAVVHHLPDVDAFLDEVTRVLRPGGRAVFMDDAFSPLWQWSKRTWLRPLMRYFHRVEQVSPEDLRFTLAGGFREEQLAARIRTLGAEPYFERSGFVHYLVTRASERLPPQRVWKAIVGREGVLRTLIAVDELLGRSQLVRKNLIRLIWGFDKPAQASGVCGRGTAH
jgi:SAM-dependent methyltransferase